MPSPGVMATKGRIPSSGDRTLLGGDGFHWRECYVLLGAFFSSVMDGARLSRLSEDGVDPFMSPCFLRLRLERELGELV
jgi:hypothetical protein